MNHTLCKQAKQKTGAAWIWDEHKQWKPGNSIYEEFGSNKSEILRVVGYVLLLLSGTKVTQ